MDTLEIGGHGAALGHPWPPRYSRVLRITESNNRHADFQSAHWLVPTYSTQGVKHGLHWPKLQHYAEPGPTNSRGPHNVLLSPTILVSLSLQPNFQATVGNVDRLLFRRPLTIGDSSSSQSSVLDQLPVRVDLRRPLSSGQMTGMHRKGAHRSASR